MKRTINSTEKISKLAKTLFLCSFALLYSCSTFKTKEPKSSLVPIGILDLSLNHKKPSVMIPGDPYVAPVLHKNKIITEQNEEWITCSEVSKNLSSVKNIWAFPNQRGGLSVSPFVIKSYVILTFKSGLVINVDMRNGRRIWSTQLPGSLIERPIVSHNAHIFLASSNQRLYSLKLKDGSIKWVYKVGENKEAKIRTLNKPLFFRNNIYLGNNDGEIKSLKIESGSLNWSFKPQFSEDDNPFKDYMGEFFILDQTLYASRYDGHVFALDISKANKKQLKWHFKTDENITTSSYDSGRYFIGTNKGSVHAFDIKTGKDRWNKKSYFGKIAISTIATGEKNTYITGSRGDIFLLKGTEGLVQWHGNLSIPIFNPPIYFKGKLLFPGQEKSKLYIYLTS